ncbi:hypothetical protein [Pseudomonas turukhanskensis]|uniref:CN hydrolase domain-containing protein n=1 Tax=Pseudomonas turukhanskensis TaxID=1806536 RepID=A0A9W6K8K8_9PSED|nr:hypothetical protein [Pseudomonas turukhanskensis]GLK91441.1 hypothetical protein GCM10017655_45050 [Pseudomonas turukhanskensis]
MRSGLHALNRHTWLCNGTSRKWHRANRLLGLFLLALVCAVPFGLAFAYESGLAPYLALVAFTPAMYVVGRLRAAAEVVLFSLVTSVLTIAMVTYWVPTAIADMVAVGTAGAGLLSALLWLLWCGGNALFLIVYRYWHARHLLQVACLGVVLVNHWPSVFGVNPFISLMHADALSGGAFFIGTTAIELLAILFSAYLAKAAAEASLRPLLRALPIVLTLLVLDYAAVWYSSLATSRSLTVALVQAGNVYSQKLASATDIEKFVRQITDGPGGGADLVVFSENVFSFNFADDPTSANAALEALKRFSAEREVAFLLSAVQASPDEEPTEPGRAKNTRVSSQLINQGQLQGYADKAKTIPFAEYTPSWAVAPFRWLGVKVESRAPSYDYHQGMVKGVRIIPLTCFESIDQAVVETRLDARPGLLVSQSNLDSFGQPGSSTYRAALWAHMAHERRWTTQWQVPVVRAVKGGGSTQVNAQGYLDQALLQQSWGQEWVSATVTVPEFTALNGALALLRQVSAWLIGTLAFCYVAQGAVLYVRRKWLPGKAD